MAPNHYLNQWWNIVNWTLRNKLQWNFNRNSNIFIQENALENVVCEMASILSLPQCVNNRHSISKAVSWPYPIASRHKVISLDHNWHWSNSLDMSMIHIAVNTKTLWASTCLLLHNTEYQCYRFCTAFHNITLNIMNNGISHKQQVKIMTANGLAPSISNASAVTILTLKDNKFLVLLEEGFWLPVSCLNLYEMEIHTYMSFEIVTQKDWP